MGESAKHQAASSATRSPPCTEKYRAVPRLGERLVVPVSFRTPGVMSAKGM
jgi:hypothetical protein